MKNWMGWRELLNPEADFVFKQIFGSEDQQDVLLSYLNAVFEGAGQPLVTHVETLHPFLDTDALSDKMSVLDVKARTEADGLVEVEIPLQNRRNMEQRTLFYWAKLFQGQLSEGGSYHVHGTKRSPSACWILTTWRPRAITAPLISTRTLRGSC